MAKTGKKQNFRVDVMPGGDIIAHFLLLGLQRFGLSQVPDHYYSFYTISNQVVLPPQLQMPLKKSTHPWEKGKLLECLLHPEPEGLVWVISCHPALRGCRDTAAPSTGDQTSKQTPYGHLTATATCLSRVSEPPPVCHYARLSRRVSALRGAWLAHWVEHVILDLGFVSSSLTLCIQFT